MELNCRVPCSTINPYMEENSIFLSEDILEEMLCRMSVKQLLQLRCVSKLWHSLIDNHNFIMKHYQTCYAMLKEEDNIPFFTDKPSVYDGNDPALLPSL